jgi:predicted helicase
MLVKNAKKPKICDIRYHDIGDDLSAEDKVRRIAALDSVMGIGSNDSWVNIYQDSHGDWLRQRDESFDKYFLIGAKGSTPVLSIFGSYSMGIKTNRDEWVYNFSKQALISNVSAMLKFYNSELDRFKMAQAQTIDVAEFVSRGVTKIKWTTDVLSGFGKGIVYSIDLNSFACSIYRPFSKMWVYSNKDWNWTRHLMPSYFPDSMSNNCAIVISGVGARSGFSALKVDILPNLHVLDTGQCFPRYLYEPTKPEDEGGLFAGQGGDAPAYTRRDAITDEGLAHFLKAYPGETITKDDLFHYVYGLLHSEDYRERYADNLTKQLPRIPLMKRAADFWAFVEAGRALGDLHVGYETVEPYPVTIAEGDLRLAHIADPVAYFRVEKMKFAGKRGEVDKSTVIYNPRITMTNIPLEAYDYVVNGKSALDWVMERQCVKTEPASGIVNDANRYANETVGDPAYPLNLFRRVITVSLETMRIVRGLPALEILEPVG